MNNFVSLVSLAVTFAVSGTSALAAPGKNSRHCENFFEYGESPVVDYGVYWSLADDGTFRFDSERAKNAAITDYQRGPNEITIVTGKGMMNYSKTMKFSLDEQGRVVRVNTFNTNDKVKRDHERETQIQYVNGVCVPNSFTYFAENISSVHRPLFDLQLCKELEKLNVQETISCQCDMTNAHKIARLLDSKKVPPHYSENWKKTNLEVLESETSAAMKGSSVFTRAIYLLDRCKTHAGARDAYQDGAVFPKSKPDAGDGKLEKKGG